MDNRRLITHDLGLTATRTNTHLQINAFLQRPHNKPGDLLLLVVFRVIYHTVVITAALTQPDFLQTTLKQINLSSGAGDTASRLRHEFSGDCT